LEPKGRGEGGSAVGELEHALRKDLSTTREIQGVAAGCCIRNREPSISRRAATGKKAHQLIGECQEIQEGVSHVFHLFRQGKKSSEKGRAMETLSRPSARCTGKRRKMGPRGYGHGVGEEGGGTAALGKKEKASKGLFRKRRRGAKKKRKKTRKTLNSTRGRGQGGGCSLLNGAP